MLEIALYLILDNNYCRMDESEYQMAGDAMVQFTNLKIKFHCLQENNNTVDVRFQECCERLAFLNFKYFNDIMINIKKKQEQAINKEIGEDIE